MGRPRIPITWIKSDASRQVTYTKRRKGLKKKIEELAILCGVEACMICYAPPASKPSGPFTWGLPDVSQVISKYQSLSKEEQDKKKLDNKSLLEQQIKKLKVELRLRVDQNQKLEREQAYPLWDERLNCYGVEDLKCLGEYLAEKASETYEKITQLTNQQQVDDDQDTLNSLNSKNMFLLQGQLSAGEYDFSAFPSDNIPRNMFRQAVSTLPFTPHNFPAVLGLQAYPTTVNFPVQSSQELFGGITMPDLSANLSDPGTRSQGGLTSDMHQMLTISSDDKMQQLPRSTRKSVQLQNLQYGYVGRTSSGLIPPTVSASGISVRPSTSRKKLQFNPTVLNDWPADPPVVSQTSVLQMEVGDGSSEAIHLQLQASLDESRSLNQQQSAHTP